MCLEVFLPDQGLKYQDPGGKMLNLVIKRVKNIITRFYKNRDDFTFEDVIINTFLIHLGYCRGATNLN